MSKHHTKREQTMSKRRLHADRVLFGPLQKSLLLNRRYFGGSPQVAIFARDKMYAKQEVTRSGTYFEAQPCEEVPAHQGGMVKRAKTM